MIVKNFFKYILATIGWILIVLYLFIYIYGASNVLLPDGEFHKNPLSFKYMVVEPLIFIINDISNSFYVDAIIRFIPFIVLNAPFIIGLAIIFPKRFKSIFYIYFIPKNIFLENYFGVGKYRILFILSWIVFIVGITLTVWDNVDFNKLDPFYLIPFLIFWPFFMGTKKMYYLLKKYINIGSYRILFILWWFLFISGIFISLCIYFVDSEPVLIYISLTISIIYWPIIIGGIKTFNYIIKVSNKLFNKYCDWIGVKNEGIKRIIIVIYFLLFFQGIIIGPFWIWFLVIGTILFPSTKKIIGWIMDGFKK